MTHFSESRAADWRFSALRPATTPTASARVGAGGRGRRGRGRGNRHDRASATASDPASPAYFNQTVGDRVFFLVDQSDADRRGARDADRAGAAG